LSDAYDDDMDAEQAILDRINAAEAEQDVPGSPAEQPRTIGGRPPKVDPIKLVAWRQAHSATVAETAKRWNVSKPTVQRLSREYGEAAKAERQRYQMERLDKELRAHEYGLRVMFLGQRADHLSRVSSRWFSAEEVAKGTPAEASVAAAREAALDEADREFREDWERCVGPIFE
jgi:AraC-like DNA-binding protein